MRTRRLSWSGIVALTVIALLSLHPSIDWYRRSPEERARLDSARERPGGVLNLGLDLSGGTHLLLEIDTDELPADRDADDAVDQAIEVMRNRVDQLGVSEPFIARQGERWIVLQLPGISDSAQAKALVGKTARLEFRIVDGSAAARRAGEAIRAMPRPFADDGPTREALDVLPPDTLLLQGRERPFYVVSASAPLTGADLESAHVETDEVARPVVALRFGGDGARRFYELTAANVGQQLAIVLDGVVYSAPVIRTAIPGGAAVIEGDFDVREASRLAIALRAGALPAPVRIVEERTVGATLGEDSIRAGLLACVVGIALVFVFFVAYYRVLGAFAVAALGLNLLLLLALMAHVGATLTLPGIAGISLNVAMAVDANILILERIREELGRGTPLRAAVLAGYEASASAIFDSNLTVLAASLLLFLFGSGPIKGFAVTLSLGNCIAMFTATVVTKLMATTWLTPRRGRAPRRWTPRHLFATPAIDWIGKRRYCFAACGVLLAVSAGSLLVRGVNYGIDFTGGTLVEVTTAAPRSLADLRAALEQAGYGNAELQRFAGTNTFAIRVKGGAELDARSVDAMVDALRAVDPTNEIRVDRKEYVGPAVGAHLKQQAFLAVGLAIAAIVLYVAVRFANPLWGAAGIVALAHDVAVTLGVISLARIEVDLVVMAAILTIAGYSINDTIVIFDRMRERQRSAKRESLRALINASINDTLSRTLLTNGNVLAVVLVLLLLGGEVLHDFAFVMVVGGLVGTFSTIAVATPLIYERQGRLPAVPERAHASG